MMGCINCLAKEFKMVGCRSNVNDDICTTWWSLGYKTGSADGCGSSWLLCHGALIPEFFPIDTIIELSHRAVSALSLWSYG